MFGKSRSDVLATYSEDVDKALNYKEVCKEIINHVEEGRFLLLEKLVGDVLNLAAEHPWGCLASVTIDKLNALRFAVPADL